MVCSMHLLNLPILSQPSCWQILSKAKYGGVAKLTEVLPVHAEGEI